METTATKRPTKAALLLVVSGVLCALGGLLDWGSLTSSDGSVTIQGGSLGLLLGLLAAAFGVAVYLVASRPVRIVVGVIAVAAGGFLTLAGVAALTDDSVFARTAATALLEGAGAPTDEASLDESEQILVQGIESGEIERSVDLGLYAFIAGSLLMVVGGIVAIVTSRTGPPAAAASGVTPPPPVTVEPEAQAPAPSARTDPPTP